MDTGEGSAGPGAPVARGTSRALPQPPGGAALLALTVDCLQSCCPRPPRLGPSGTAALGHQPGQVVGVEISLGRAPSLRASRAP